MATSGNRHIVARYGEGAKNHETTAYARNLWQQALFQSGKPLGTAYLCHFKQCATPGGVKRTMKVFVDYKSYQGFQYKGIITAYWVNGHESC